MDNCSNEGSTLEATKYITDSGEKYAYVGGYVGKGYLISNCTNTVNINYTSDGKYVGGIIGYTSATGTISIENLKNSANITGNEYVGGIIGYWNGVSSGYNKYSLQLEGFENSGSIESTGNYCGGIIGYMKFTVSNDSYLVKIIEFKNTGDIIGKTYVGGLIGYGESDSSESYIKDYIISGNVMGISDFDKVVGKKVYIKVEE